MLYNINMSVVKFIIPFAGSAIALFTVIIVLRTLTLRVHTTDVQSCRSSDFDFIPATSEVLERFRQALRFQTVAKEEHDYNRDELGQFVSFIQSEYPALHSSPLVTYEVVAGYSLLYTVKGSNPALTPYLLMAHLDVVPADPAQWEAPPFSAEIIDDFIYARGTIDFKHGVMGILEALSYLVSYGKQQERGFFVAFGHDEEVMGTDGAKAISSLLWDRGVHKLEFILDEGLTVVHNIIPGMSTPAALIGTAEKGHLTVELAVEGSPGHSSMPLPESTIGILAAAVSRLERNPHPSMLGYGPEKETFEQLAPYMNLPFRVVMSNLWCFKPAVTWVMSKKPETNALIRTTTAVTMFKAGIKINVNAPDAKAYVNHRIHPAQTVQEVLDYDRSIINDERVNITAIHNMEPHPIAPSGEDDFGYQTVKNSIRQVWNNTYVAPATMLGNTDTRHYLGMTGKVYRFSPSVMYPGDLKRFHGNNERISIQNYEQAINFYYHVMRNADKAGLGATGHTHTDL